MSLLTANEPLFDPDVLKRLDFSKFASKFNPPVSPTSAGDALIIRPLRPSDYRDYYEVMSHLTDVGKDTDDLFFQRFATMKSCPNTYHVVVIEDTNTGRLVGVATMIIEQKLSHGKRAMLDDVAVSKGYRGRQLGKLLVATIIALSLHMDCYKITLDCEDKLIPFYKNFGFVCELGTMAIRFNT